MSLDMYLAQRLLSFFLSICLLLVVLERHSHAQTLSNTLGNAMPEYQSGADMSAHDAVVNSYGTAIAIRDSELIIGNRDRGTYKSK